MGAVAVLAGVPLVSLGLAAGGASASAAPTLTIYPGIARPVSIAAGPDGALWFTNHANNTIGRITTTGKVHLYAGVFEPEGITAGPDGALWFTNRESIGRITTTGSVTNNYQRPDLFMTNEIAPGPDGTVWFTADYAVGRITTSVTPGIKT
jgi:virginiamycin B lyase